MNTVDRILLSNVFVWYAGVMILIMAASLMVIPNFINNVWKYGGNTATLMLKLNVKELGAYGKILLPFRENSSIMETYKRVRYKMLIHEEQ